MTLEISHEEQSAADSAVTPSPSPKQVDLFYVSTHPLPPLASSAKPSSSSPPPPQSLSSEIVDRVIQSALDGANSGFVVGESPIVLVHQQVFSPSIQLPNTICGGAYQLVHLYDVATPKNTAKASRFANTEPSSSDGDVAAAVEEDAPPQLDEKPVAAEEQEEEGAVAAAAVEEDGDAVMTNIVDTYTIKSTTTVEFAGCGISNGVFGRINCERIGVYVSANGEWDQGRVNWDPNSGNVLYIPHGKPKQAALMDQLAMTFANTGKAIVYITDPSAAAAAAASTTLSSSSSEEAVVEETTPEQEEKKKERAEKRAAKKNEQLQTLFKGWSTATYDANQGDLISVDSSRSAEKSASRHGWSIANAWIQKHTNPSTLKKASNAFAKYRSDHRESAIAGWSRLAAEGFHLPHVDKDGYKSVAFRQIASALANALKKESDPAKSTAYRTASTSIGKLNRANAVAASSKRKRQEKRKLAEMAAAAEGGDGGDGGEKKAGKKSSSSKRRKLVEIHPEATGFILDTQCLRNPNRVLRRQSAAAAAQQPQLTDEAAAQLKADNKAMVGWVPFTAETAADHSCVDLPIMLNCVWQYIRRAGLKNEEAKSTITVDTQLSRVFRRNDEYVQPGTVISNKEILTCLKWLITYHDPLPEVIAEAEVVAEAEAVAAE